MSIFKYNKEEVQPEETDEADASDDENATTDTEGF